MHVSPENGPSTLRGTDYEKASFKESVSGKIRKQGRTKLKLGSRMKARRQSTLDIHVQGWRSKDGIVQFEANQLSMV